MHPNGWTMQFLGASIGVTVTNNSENQYSDLHKMAATNINTVSHKNKTLEFWSKRRQMYTDSRNSSTARFTMKLCRPMTGKNDITFTCIVRSENPKQPPIFYSTTDINVGFTSSSSSSSVFVIRQGMECTKSSPIKCNKIKTYKPLYTIKASHTRYQALGPKLMPVYRQSARRWP